MKHFSQIKPIALALTLACSSTFLLSGCNEATASVDKEQQTEKEVVKVPVEAFSVSRGPISSYYSANAVLESVEEADVIAKVQGLIEKVHVEEGDFVNKGQLLAEIDSTRYQLTLAQRKAELKQVKSEYDRLTQMNNPSVISADQLEKLEWQYKSLEALTKLAQLDVKEAKVVAPISGYISERYVKPGNLVQNYQHKNLFHIVSQDRLQGVLHLPESQFANIQAGQKVKLTLPALPNSSFSAQVERISPVIDPQSGTFKVVIAMDNSNQQLKSGMFAEVNIEYGYHDNSLLAPANAVLTMDNKNIVYKVVDGKAIKVEVATGFRQDGVVEIVSGLEDGAELITAGHNNLKDQADVNVINRG
jgi:RND family efflux transporter MFP subunit